ncbi:hypothetical protein [Sediminimonas sp.]|uniref:hypothetical protein n=1 Tax=Sediminimonas sp. TaxID=2823379 RepID=UPI0025D7E0F9|nr:hypothetical protein [Sediminimonas sp.]
MKNKETLTPKEIGEGITGLLMMGFLVWGAYAVWSWSSTDDGVEEGTATESETVEPTEPEVECGRDLQCLDKEHGTIASLRCEPLIEDLAEYSHRWTDTWLEPKFDRISWANMQENQIVIIGDKIEFQNGFGAFQRVLYKCVYDFGNETVVEATVEPYSIYK